MEEWPREVETKMAEILGKELPPDSHSWVSGSKYHAWGLRVGSFGPTSLLLTIGYYY